jgi:rhodanese-related sulfurtransferase
MEAVSARRVSELLAGSGELALLDVREQGVHYRGHPFFACSAPLSRLELVIGDLVPRRTVPAVLLDGGNEGLAAKAEKKLEELGYTDVSILEGGCAGWKQAGLELFSGVNVPSKAFGEFVEHHYGTPRIAPGELKRLQEFKKIVVVDSRPFEEYQRMNIPGGIDMPGAELVYRIHDLAPSPDTLVVVNCAGRTRSIIGCQSLRNAGIPNPVAALKDGTMGWELAGFPVERGAERVAPLPSDEGRKRALEAAQRVAKRFWVKFASSAQLAEWRKDPVRTLYILDVRTREEFERSHVAGSRHAPGGQLVQASDEYVGVRNARVVLVDPDQVRAIMTASWLNQMGWNDVYVLEDPQLTESGPRKPNIPAISFWQTVSTIPAEAAVLDLSTSLRFAKGHIPGAWWGVRSRLSEARAIMGGPALLVLTSEDGVLAHLAAPDAAKLWSNEIAVLAGGNAAWRGPTQSGIERATTTRDDVWYKPYDHSADYLKHAREYLDWEVALVEQIKRDPTIRFRTFS